MKNDDINGFINVNDRDTYDVNLRWKYENGFWLTSGNERLAKIIAHWVLMNIALQGNSVTGDIVECGTLKGTSLIQFAAYRKFMAAEDTRKLIAFDAFGAFSSSGEESIDDLEFIKKIKAEDGDYGISTQELEKVFVNKGFKNYEFVQGDVCQTVPEYVKANHGLRLAVLHIDLDVYKPTYSCLENLYDNVVRGGIIILDDYRKVPGAPKAIDDFFNNRKIGVTIQQLPFSNIAFIIKR
jgi:hypothetical protein